MQIPQSAHRLIISSYNLEIPRIESYKRSTMKRSVPSLSEKQSPKRFKTVSQITPDRRLPRLAGDYILGPEIQSAPLNCITQFLAIKNDKFYKLKILTIDPNDSNPSKETIQGKILIHNEFALLNLLQGSPGIERCYEMISDTAMEEKVEVKNSKVITTFTGKEKRRIILVLDAFCEKSCDWMNINTVNHEVSLQEYISRKKLNEKDALLIFYEIVKIVEFIHSRSIIHRDLKLHNFLFNLQTHRVTLTNFCLGKLLSSDDMLLLDQRGSPAYISPDVLNGPYLGKPSDIWTLGVILYIIVYSNFPFIENTTAALFKKIRQCDLVLPSDPSIRVSDATKKLIKNHLLTINPNDRYTAQQIRVYIERQIEKYRSSQALTPGIKDDQVVPNICDEIDQPIYSRKFLADPTSKFELSSEPLSSTLKNFPPPNQEQKQFLKPSLLSERCNRIPPVTPAPHGNSNVGITRNLTRQINNLTVRNRNNVNTGLSWHNRISASHLYEGRFRNTSTGLVNASNSGAVRAQPQQVIVATPSEAIFNTLNDLFSSGNFPQNAITHDFCGLINQDISLKLSIWLRSNFGDNELVREVYQPETHQSRDDIVKFIDFLRKCNIDLESTVNGQIFLKREQSQNNLLFLTYLLQIAGYNNNYFINIRG